MTERQNNNWEELARAAGVEQDSEKLIEIVEALNRALEERSKPQPQESAPRTSRLTNSVYC